VTIAAGVAQRWWTPTVAASVVFAFPLGRIAAISLAEPK
jgi:hypothetical protein